MLCAVCCVLCAVCCVLCAVCCILTPHPSLLTPDPHPHPKKAASYPSPHYDGPFSLWAKHLQVEQKEALVDLLGKCDIPSLPNIPIFLITLSLYQKPIFIIIYSIPVYSLTNHSYQLYPPPSWWTSREGVFR